MYKFRHLNKRERETLYPQIAQMQDGAYCNNCGATRRSLEACNRDSKLVIDRKDNTKGYYLQDPVTGTITPNWSNLQLCCKGCNNTHNAKQPTVEDRKMTPEMAVNRAKEPFFRKWVHGIVDSEGCIEYEDCVNSGAEFVGVATETTTNYLKKMLSKRAGDYEIGWGKNGGTYIYEKGMSPKSLEDAGNPEL